MQSTLGLIPTSEGSQIIVVDNGRVALRDSLKEENIPNFDILKNRDSRIGSDEVFGDGVFDFRYGPVTSGFIESGSFHIYTYGERMLAVNIDLSTKHRGIEKSCVGLPVTDAVRKVENICGNFAFSHSVAYSRAVESALAIKPSEMTKKLRVIGLELERLYNHLFVATRLAGSAAQKVLNAHLLYLFEEALRVNQLLTGSRNLKNFNSIGKAKPLSTESFGPSIESIGIARYQLSRIYEKLGDLYDRSLESENFMDRLHETATLSSDRAIEIGITGPSLRASGVEFDLRKSDPDYPDFKVVKMEQGDALARYEVRCLEVMESAKIVAGVLDSLYELGAANVHPVDAELEILSLSGASVGVCESPTGVIATYVEIKKGTIVDLYISTPSLFGFAAMREAMVGQIFTDFPFGMDSYGVSFADAAR